MKTILNVFLFWAAINIAYAQSQQTRLKHHNHQNGLAIDGYDPVAYFTLNKALKGKAECQITHQGITYRFVNETHKKLFLKEPNKYEPQYGGWCAFAMGDYGKKVKVDPETFKITNGKLYLFYNFYLNNTLTDWNKNETKLIQSGDANWRKLFH